MARIWMRTIALALAALLLPACTGNDGSGGPANPDRPERRQGGYGY